MKLLTKLYPHQYKAVEKLQKIKVGALYMEMGTGKTRVALELIKLRLDAGKVDHVLWLCPCSVKESLKRDIKKHTTGDLSMFTICGIETLSSSIRANAILLRLVQEKKVYLIVDESNLVKNHRAKRTTNITKLAEFCPYKLILNGTPITKNEKDLFSQWYILDWRILGYQSFWSFEANHLEYDDFGRIRRTLNLDYLVGKIAPYTYQVKKNECLDLPRKTYDTVYCHLTERQREHYQNVANDLLLELDELEPHTIYRLFTGLQNVISGLKVTVETNLKSKPFFNNPLDNPRIETLLNLINKIEEKAIIFCKYTHEIETITELINGKYGEGTAVKFYGELNQKKRQNNLKKFENEARFLVANKTCAGYGLNLQFCSYAIYYSNDWDYATRGQSEDRVHRMGQENNVHYIDICAAYTLDERILECLRKKENLVECFKAELEDKKDINILEKYLYYKDYKGRTKLSKIEQEKVKAIEELQEVY
ncbi:MAG: DEAD/DEAH box helicase [Anaerocolumna aminovalerica]|uniref:DEAD/DEAH box helicase n=1 Tax=Anaerocolumna aminovalerica TaxID=1527 RepID=UPI00291022B6|nr:DEAD/DEAH box helicase [Anaerocolumna aminovalerica]MDU6263742.1 DEAD/DEAH box helicase [Anaerocolumna aminovalerica]